MPSYYVFGGWPLILNVVAGLIAFDVSDRLFCALHAPRHTGLVFCNIGGPPVFYLWS